MSDEPGGSDQPIPGGFRSWREYQVAQETPRRAAPEISAERQAALRAAYEANIAAGAPPYAGVRFQSGDELEWALAEHGWEVGKDSFEVKNVLLPQGVAVKQADLREAVFGKVNLAGFKLRRADLRQINLVGANLANADLVDADLAGAHLGFADLHGANLHSASLAGAHLRQANLAGATLRYADLRGARLYQANLAGANLVGAHMDASTVLARTQLDGRTQLRDVAWGGAALSRIAWERLPMLGDEVAPRQRWTASENGPGKGERKPKSRAQRLAEYRGASRAYQQLSVALRVQGLDDAAARYAYQAQVLQRKAFWQAGAVGRWLFSWLLAALAGYGYRLQRILITYILTLTAFALIYYVVGLPNEHVITLPQRIADAYQVSLTAIHGRTFFEQFGIGSTLAWVAAAESVCGLVIEAVFTSMLVQRFFAR